LSSFDNLKIHATCTQAHEKDLLTLLTHLFWRAMRLWNPGMDQPGRPTVLLRPPHDLVRLLRLPRTFLQVAVSKPHRRSTAFQSPDKPTSLESHICQNRADKYTQRVSESPESTET